MADTSASSSASDSSSSDPLGLVRPGASDTVKKRRDWCVTLNNYTPEDVANVRDVFKTETKSAVCGFEVGACGTPHLQMYVEYPNARAFSTVCRSFPRAHIEYRSRGTPTQAWDYCLKACSGPDQWSSTEALTTGHWFQWGKRPSGQGHRSDVDVVRSSLRAGESIRSFALDVGPQMLRHAECLVKYTERKRTWKPVVVWLYGPSGSGKSKMVDDLTAGQDVYQPPVDQVKWFNGYDGHSHVWFDDFRGHQASLTHMLRLLDRWACVVETKGGSRQLLATHIYITSAEAPHTVYSNTSVASVDRREKIHQLLRRIDIVIRMDQAYQVHYEKESEMGRYYPADGYHAFNDFLDARDAALAAVASGNLVSSAPIAEADEMPTP